MWAIYSVGQALNRSHSGLSSSGMGVVTCASWMVLEEKNSGLWGLTYFLTVLFLSV